MKKLTVGFIGLGLMGKPMAKNILKRGFPLIVYNRTLAKAAELKRLGAKVALSPAELAESADVVITMVTGPKEVRSLLFKKDGVVCGDTKKGLVVIDMSTIGPASAREIAQDLQPFGIDFIDAPVTGSTPKAISGELTIFVGGQKETFLKVKKVLQAMGTTIHHLGDVGLGQAIKLVNNSIVASTMAALAEGFLLGEKEGLKKDKIAQVLSGVPALSPFMKLKLEHMEKNRYPTLFSAANMHKDLRLALKELPTGQKLPQLKLVSKLYKDTLLKGLGDKDISAVLETLKDY